MTKQRFHMIITLVNVFYEARATSANQPFNVGPVSGCEASEQLRSLAQRHTTESTMALGGSMSFIT